MLVELVEIPINELSAYKDKTILCEAELMDVVFYPNGLLKRTSFNMPSSSKYYKIAQPKPAKEPFRPYWSIVDDGGHGRELGKIYTDQINRGKDELRYKLDSYLVKALSDYEYYAPEQLSNQETDFSILDENGNLYKAFWKGKADE